MGPPKEDAEVVLGEVAYLFVEAIILHTTLGFR